MAVLHEVQAADAVHVDGRDRLAAPLGQGQPLPPLPDARGGGPEPAVEIPGRVDGADDRIQPDGLQAKLALAAHPQGGDDLVQRHDEVDVIGFAAQPVGEPGQRLPAPGALEVVLDVGLGEAGVSGHRDDRGAVQRGRHLARARAGATR